MIAKEGKGPILVLKKISHKTEQKHSINATKNELRIMRELLAYSKPKIQLNFNTYLSSFLMLYKLQHIVFIITPS